MKVIRKPAVFEARQFDGINIPSFVKVLKSYVIYSQNREYYYISASGHPMFGMSWLSVRGTDEDRLPFAFYELKSGDREVVTKDDERVKRYAAVHGWDLSKFRNERYIAEGDGVDSRCDIEIGDWLVYEEDGAEIYTDAEFKARFQEAT